MLALAVAPGPDLALIVSHALARGARAGVWCSVGIYFGMSVLRRISGSDRDHGGGRPGIGVDALVNMSQMTVSQMSIQNTTPSPQQRQHWLGEQALGWSALP